MPLADSNPPSVQPSVVHQGHRPDLPSILEQDGLACGFIIRAVESATLARGAVYAPIDPERFSVACITPAGELRTPIGTPYLPPRDRASALARRLQGIGVDMLTDNDAEPCVAAICTSGWFILAVAGLPRGWNEAVVCDAALAAGLVGPEEARRPLAGVALAGLDLLRGIRAAYAPPKTAP